MFSTPEQFSSATKTAFESQFSLMTTLTQKALEGVGKLVELNMTVARTTMNESSLAMQTLASAKSPQEFLALSTAQSNPGAEKALAYARGVAGIASEVHSEITKITESRIADTKRKVAMLMDDLGRNAPAGSENMMALFKSALGNATTGYEQATASTRQAMAKMDSNVARTMPTVVEITESKSVRSAAKKIIVADR